MLYKGINAIDFLSEKNISFLRKEARVLFDYSLNFSQKLELGEEEILTKKKLSSKQQF